MSSFIWILIFIGVMYWMHGKGGGCCGGGHSHGDNDQNKSAHNDGNSRTDTLHYSHSKQVDGHTLHKDPFCGSNVAEDVAIKKIIDGTNYYFCSQECLDKFMLTKN